MKRPRIILHMVCKTPALVAIRITIVAVIPQLGQYLWRKLNGMPRPGLVARIAIYDRRYNPVQCRLVELRRADADNRTESLPRLYMATQETSPGGAMPRNFRRRYLPN